MRNQLLLLLATVVPAAAQPVTQPAPCEVTISRAPDDVRRAIEAWVHAEPRCATTLDVRVVPTDGGFYLFARDPSGRVRERVVPDAQSAGVLVASWVADDLIQAMPPAPPVAAPPAAAPPATAPPAPVAAPRTAPSAPSSAAPIAAPGMAPAVVAAAPPRERATRWLSVGGVVQPHAETAGGARAELDLVHHGKLTLSAALALTRTNLYVERDFAYGDMEVDDVRALAMLSRSYPLGGRWDLRIGAGVGFLHSSVNGLFQSTTIDQTSVSPIAEGSLLLSRTIGDNWGLAFAPMATWFSREVTLMDDAGGMFTLERRGFEVMLFGGLRRRL